MSDLLRGLNVSVWSFGLTFVAIGLLVLVIIAVDRLFPVKPEKGEGEETVSEPAGELAGEESDDAEVAAAIAAALYRLQEEEPMYEELGSALLSGPGPWWSVRRYPQQPVRVASEQRRD